MLHADGYVIWVRVLTMLGVFMFLLNILLDCAQSMILNNLRLRMTRDFKVALLRDCMYRPYQMHNHQHQGEILTKVMQDASVVVDHTAMLVPNMAIRLIKTLLLIYICLTFGGNIVLATICGMCIYYIAETIAGQYMAKINYALRASTENIYNVIGSSFSDLLPIKCSRNEADVLKRFRKEYHINVRQQIDWGFFTFIKKHGEGMLLGGFIFFVSFYMITQVIRGIYTFGYFVAYSMFLRMLINNLAEYGTVWNSIIASVPSFERAHSLIDYESQATRIYNSVNGYTLALKDISFSIRGENILPDTTVIIEQGQLVLIAGDNGAGKTTLLHIINGVLQPDTGFVSLDDKELSLIKTECLKNSICQVTQMSKLSNGSSEDNTALECGSQGEEYMKALRNAIATEPNILLLDEPFANLDKHHSSEVSRALERIKGHVTVILTCHHVEDVKLDPDTIIYLKKGARSEIKNMA